MRKILFLVAISGLMYSAIGQTATGDKPVFSKNYSFYAINDSTLSYLTYYTYDGNKRIIKEISDYSSSQDSTITAYDAKGRVVSINQFSDGELFISQVWNYDDVNSRIELSVYSDGEMSGNTILYGVKDMDATDEGISVSMMGDITLRDCDSMHINVYDANSSSLVPIGRVYPFSQGGKVIRAKYIIDVSFAAAMLGEDFPIDELPFTEMEMNMVFTYHQNGKILTMKASMSIDIGMGIPIPMDDFMTVSFQYYGNLLTETISAIDISMAVVGQIFYQGTREVYLYNQENNLLCTENYSSESGGTWALDSKIWYYYEDGVGISCAEDLSIAMGQNIPNPANNSTYIEYSVANAGQVNFNLHNINGQLLLQQTEYVTEGSHQMEINTANLANGIYFYSMEINGKRITKKMSVRK